MENKFSERLRELRLGANLKQIDLAQQFGVTKDAVSKWELGSETDFNTLMEIAKFFNVTVDYLLGMSEY